nr:NADH dehydrogenase subunit 4L [Manota sp. WQY001]
MLNNLNFMMFLMFFCGCYMFISNRKFLLMTLLSLEFIILSLFLLLFFSLNLFNYEMYLSQMFLIISVCEGVLGLSILVSMIRAYGNNFIQSFNILLC